MKPFLTARDQAELREAKRLAMPAPTNLRFEEWPHEPRTAVAYDGDRIIGKLNWMPDDWNNEVEYISVHPEFQRHGVARQLFEWVKQNMAPGLSPSTTVTPQGKAWSKAMGFKEQLRPYYDGTPGQFETIPAKDDTLGWQSLDRSTGHTASLNEFLYRYAMPRSDAYDLNQRGNPDQTPVRPGPWYHTTRGKDLAPGTILDPNGGPKSFSYLDEKTPRKNWVFMHPQQAHTEVYGDRLYEVEPLDEGPYAYNGEDKALYDGYVSPRARVVREIKRERPQESVDLADAMSRMAAVPGKIYRGLTLDMDSATPQMRKILNDFGPESPEFISELLAQGTGTYWSRDPGFAKSVNPGNGLHVVLESEWDGNDADQLHPELTRKLPDSWGDMSLLAPTDNTVAKEFNLKPNKELNVRSIKVRKRDDPDYRELLRQPVRARTARLVIAMPYYHNTYSDFSPGEEIIPWAERNMGYDAPGRSEATGYDPNSVYLSDETAKPEHFDWYGPNRYEVEPIGDVSLDPEYKGSPELGASYKAPRARVVRRMPIDKTAMVLGMCTINELVNLVKEI